MSRRFPHTAGWEFRRLLVSLTFAGVVYLTFASGLYSRIVNLAISWYVDQITPLSSAASPAPS